VRLCLWCSERSLRLTGLCLRLNPANYTVWHFRRQCLSALGRAEDGGTIQQDLDLAASLGGDNPKNYQIWYHRRALLEKCPSLKDFVKSELEYIADVLDEDGKNYHAWSHRQWVVSAANDEEQWKSEMDFAKRLIDDDPRNNSAWNQRWFSVHRGKKDALTYEVARGECDFAIGAGANLDPFNESPWRYLVGIVKEQWRVDKTTDLVEEYETQAAGLRAMLTQADKSPDSCVNLTSARIDLLEMKGDKAALELAMALCKGLMEEHDQIRCKYWNLRIDEMAAKCRAL